MLTTVRDLTVQAANSGVMDDTARDAFITQFRALKADLESAANTTTAPRSVFAGSSTEATAYTSADGFAAATTAVSRRVGDAQTVRVDTPGAAAFGSGATSAFAVIDGIVADLQNGVVVNPKLNDVDAAFGTLRAAQADVGVRHAAALGAQDALKTSSVALETRRAGIEDLDLAGAVLDLQVQQTTSGSPRRHREGPAADPDGLPPMSIDLTFPTPPFGLSPAPVFTLEPVEGAEGLFALHGDDARLFLLDAAVHLPTTRPSSPTSRRP